MIQLVATLFAFFGGLLFWALDSLTFKTGSARIKKVIMFILACVPVVGCIAYGIIYINDCFNYQKWGFHNTDGQTQVRDTWLNRVLFDDVAWSEVDERKQKERERKEREKAEALAKKELENAKKQSKAEQKRQAKLMEGMEPKTDLNTELRGNHKGNADF